MTTPQHKDTTLDEILEQHREWIRGIRTDHLVGTSNEQTKQALLQWRDKAVVEAKEETANAMIQVALKSNKIDIYDNLKDFKRLLKETPNED